MNSNKPTLKDKLQYYANELFTKRTVFKIIFLFAASLIFIFLLSLTLSLVSGDAFFSLSWQTLLHLLDPGVISGDENETPYLIIMLIATIGGMILFGTLVGIINDGITNRLSSINSGHYKIVEKNHIIIIGFNEEIFEILQELIEYNKEQKSFGQKPNTIVILDDSHTVAQMSSAVEASIGRHRGSRIIYRMGSSFNPESISMCGVNQAKNVIINIKNDYQTIKWIIAVSHALQDTKNVRISAVIRELKNVLAAEYAGGNITDIVFFDDVIHQIISQSSKINGISDVIEDLIDFRKTQFITYESEKFIGKTLSEINNQLENVTVIGKLYENGDADFNPTLLNTSVQPKEALYFLADNKFILERELARFANTSSAMDMPTSIDYTFKKPTRLPKTVLILRFSRMIEMLIEEEYSNLPEGSKIYVACSSKYERILNILKLGYEEKGLEILTLKTINYYTIETLLDKCNPDKCVVLSDFMKPPGSAEENDSIFVDAEKEDEEVMLTLFFINDIAKRKGLNIDITATLQQASSKNLTAGMRDNNDFVNVGQIASHILSQVAHEPGLVNIFKKVLSGSQQHIHIYHAYRFINADGITPYDIRSVSMLLSEKGKTLIGIKTPSETILNPCKTHSWIFTEDDRIIVIENTAESSLESI